MILDYRKGYPQPQSVVGYDHKLEQQRREKWTARLERLQAEVNEVEAWIEAIPDGVTRRCFRMVYVDGMSLDQAGKKLYIDKSTVSKKINRFLKMSTHSTKSTL